MTMETPQPKAINITVVWFVAATLMLFQHLVVDRVSSSTLFWKVQTFEASGTIGIFLLAGLMLRYPKPSRVKWYLFWRWTDPIWVVLIAYILGTTIYDFSLMSGVGKFFDAPDWVFNVARGMKGAFAFIGIGFMWEYNRLALRARRRQTEAQE